MNYDNHNGSNQSIFYDEPWASTIYTTKDELKFVRTVHFLRFVLACLACLPNSFLIYLCLRRRSMRTKINYMVCNLMVANILMCVTNAAYDFLKYRNLRSPDGNGACLTITWSLIVMGDAPVWGIVLAVTTRSLNYGEASGYWNKVLTVFRLFELRFAHFIVDTVAACFVLEEIGSIVSSTECTYQLMISKSNVHFYYGLSLTIIVVTCVVGALIRRTLIRRKRGRKMSSTAITQLVIVNSSGETPGPLFARPGLLIACVLLVFLFAAPRVALLMVERHKLYAAASVCHVITALLLPFIFLFAVKDVRSSAIHFFRCRDKEERTTQVDKTAFALTNFAFNKY